MDDMTDFLRAFSFPCEKPAAYGTFHLCFFIIGLTVSVLLAFALRKTKERGCRAVLLTVGLFLFVFELYKQTFYTHVIGNGVYQWWIFPFQLCSIPMYLCFVAAFMRNGPLRQAIFDFMLAFNLMGGFVAFIEPSGLVHEYWTLTVHAFLWHMSLVFLGLFLGFSGRAGRRVRDFLPALGVFAALNAIAFALNLALWRVSKGDINMFYVGPAISPIIVFHKIAENYGWYINTPLYILCLSLAAFLFYLPFALYRQNRARRAAAQRSIA